MSDTKKQRIASPPLDSVEKQVWVSAGNFCSNPECRTYLKRDNAVIGEIAHIVDRSLDGNYRPDPEEKLVPLNQRSNASNLLLLCNNCHQAVDSVSNLGKYTIDYLRKMKAEHESWVQNEIATRSTAEYKDVANFYKEMANTWVTLARLDNWSRWVNKFDLSFTDKPCISFENREILRDLYQWHYERVWPIGILEEVGRAFDNFRNVLGYLDCAIAWYMEPETYQDYNRERFVLQKYWLKIVYRTQKEYDEVTSRFLDLSDMFGYLVTELTRAANYISNLIRQTKIDPLFRAKEGILTASLAVSREELQYDNQNYIYPFVLPDKYNNEFTKNLNV